MTDADFRSRLSEAEALAETNYRSGYQRGLRRHFHGEKFGTAQEHELLMSEEPTPDTARLAQRAGYRDGFAGKRPAHADETQRLRGGP